MKYFKSLDDYRPNVGICVFNKKGQVWVGKRAGDLAKDSPYGLAFQYQLPQGGIDEGENVIDAAYRELYEETGMQSVRLLMMTPGWLAYKFPKGYNVGRKSRSWKGQRQKWAAMLFEGKKKEIRLDTHGEIEFSDWHWAELEDLAEDYVVPFKQDVYRELVQCFLPLRDYIRSAKD